MANLAGVAFVTGFPAVATGAVAVWVLDLALRLGRMEWRDHRVD